MPQVLDIQTIAPQMSDDRASGRIQPKNFRTETGVCIQFIQQYSDRPVYDVSTVFPVSRFVGKIERTEQGWEVINVNRQPYADLVVHMTYEEAALSLLDLCRKPSAMPTKEVMHEVYLVNRRKRSKRLIVILTASDSFSEVCREIQRQIVVRGMKGYVFEGEFSLLSDPF